MFKEDSEFLLSLTIVFLNMTLALNTVLDLQNVEVTMKSRQSRTIQFMAPHRGHSQESEKNCCHGTLGYAWDQPRMPCSAMRCCNQSETVAVIPVDYALGFCFRCMPKEKIIPVCYGAGLEVRSTNQSPDYTPRACCDDAKFAVVVNKWFAGMTIRCVAR